MSKITNDMLKIYKPKSGLDWLNYKLVRDEVSFHHIEKRVDGGKKDITNGALLMPVGHQYLHLIEYRDIETYITLNKILKLINEQMKEPTMEQREIIERLLLNFEIAHRNDKNSKGKTLIQWKYKCRW